MIRLLNQWVLVSIFVLMVVCSAAAQDVLSSSGNGMQDAPSAEVPVPPMGLESPRATLRTYLNAMESGDYARAEAALNLSAVDKGAGRYIADLILDTLDRIEYVVLEEHPDARALAENPSMRGLHEWVVFPRDTQSRHRAIVQDYDPVGSIVLRRDADGGWRFSEQTVTGISDLRDSLRALEVQFGSGASQRNLVLWFEDLLPVQLVDVKFLSVKAWQWIGLGLLILIGFMLDLIVRAILRTITRRIIRNRGAEPEERQVRLTVRPFGLASAGLFWLGTIWLLGLPPLILTFLLPAVRLFAMLAMVWAAYRVTDLITSVLSAKAEATDTKIDDLIVPLVRKTAKVFITAMGVIYIADSFRIEVLPLLTGLGIGTLAFGLAAKDSIENFFGSVAVIADRPFEVGDWVKIDEVEGVVEELGFRSTRVRTFYNSLVSVPNALLVRATVDNYGRRKYRRWTTHIGITYDTPPRTIEAFCEGIREIIRLHPYTRKDYYQVWMHQFGAHSLDVLIYVFFEAPDWQTELRERHRLMLDIMRLAQHLNVSFAFPTQTLHIHNADETTLEDASDSVEVPDGNADRRAHIIGRRAVRNMTAHADWRHGKPEPYRFVSSGDLSDLEEGEDPETQIESKIGGDA